MNLGTLLKKKFPDAMDTDVISSINYLNTGIPSLNYIISGKPYSGGVPLNGKILVAYGVEGASKSTLAIAILSEALKQGYEILYIDTECSITQDRMKQFGVDIKNEKFHYITPKTMEEVFSVIEYVCLEKIKDNDDSPMYIVWDSIGSTTTKEESERTMSDIEMAAPAKVLNRDLKKIVPILHKLPHTGCLFINQSRQNMSQYGDIITMTGGQQLKHQGTVIIRVGKQEAKVEGQKCVFGTTKNKLFSPFQKTELHLDYTLGFTQEAKVTAFCDFLKTIGLLVSAGSYCDYSPELKQIILDNNYDKRIVEKENEDGTKTTEEEILFDINKKFYMKDFVKHLLENETFYNSILKASEQYVQDNIVFVTDKCKIAGIESDVIADDENDDPAEDLLNYVNSQEEDVPQRIQTSKTKRKSK